MPADQAELDYYRAVEDLFATMRGVPHVLSPKDMHLLRTWWQHNVPFTAVSSGLAEVFARRQASGEPDPVVSLGYCRHAVERHAARLAEMRAGSPAAGTASAAEAAADDRAGDLVTGLRRAAADLPPESAPVARVIERIATQIEGCATASPAELDELLYALESALLEGCIAALPVTERDRIERAAEAAAIASGAAGQAHGRTALAHRDRLLRASLGLPRLELG